MSYIFNKFTLLVIAGIIVIFTFSINEVVKLAKKMQRAQAVAYEDWASGQKTAYKTQEECQGVSSTICDYSECDFVPIGTTYEEICGKDFVTGWKPTNVVIPPVFQHIERIVLTIAAPASQAEIEIDANKLSITYRSAAIGQMMQDIETKKITAPDVTRVVNRMILYDLADVGLNEMQTEPNATILNIHTVATELPASGSPFEKATALEHTIQCELEKCQQGILDVVKEIQRVWSAKIPELKNIKLF